jgi:hypothetical protein
MSKQIRERKKVEVRACLGVKFSARALIDKQKLGLTDKQTKSAVVENIIG